MLSRDVNIVKGTGSLGTLFAFFFGVIFAGALYVAGTPTASAATLISITQDDTNFYYTIPGSPNYYYIYGGYNESYTYSNSGGTTTRCVATGTTGTETLSSLTMPKAGLADFVDDCGTGLYFVNYQQISNGEEYFFPFFYSAETDTVTLAGGGSNVRESCVEEDIVCILSYNPTPTTTLSTSTYQYMSIRYWLNDDYYTEGQTYVAFAFTPLANKEARQYTEEHIYNGTNTVSTYFTNTQEEGTYSLVLEFYRYRLFGLWKDIYKTVNVNFIVGTTSSMADIIKESNDSIFDKYSQIIDSVGCEVDLTSFTVDSIECMVSYGIAFFVPPSGMLANETKTQLLTFLSYPPLGWAKRAGEILFNATSTATSTLVLVASLPDNLPGGGSSITLDTGDALRQSVSYLNAQEIETIDGQPFDKFMYYWNLMWYIVLALWIMGQIYGMFGVDYGETHQSVYSGKLSDARDKRNSNKQWRSSSYSEKSKKYNSTIHWRRRIK